MKSRPKLVPIVVGDDGLYIDLARLPVTRDKATTWDLEDPDAYDIDGLEEALAGPEGAVPPRVVKVGDAYGFEEFERAPGAGYSASYAMADEGRRVAEEMRTGMLGSLGGPGDGDSLFGSQDAVLEKVNAAIGEGEVKAGNSLASVLAAALTVALAPEFEMGSLTTFGRMVRRHQGRLPRISVVYDEDGSIRVSLGERAVADLVACLMDADALKPGCFDPGPHLLPIQRPWPSNHGPGGYWDGNHARSACTTDPLTWRLSKWREAWRDPGKKMPLRLLRAQPPGTFFSMEPAPAPSVPGRPAFVSNGLGRGRFVRRGAPGWSQEAFEQAESRVHEDGRVVYDDELFDAGEADAEIYVPPSGDVFHQEPEGPEPEADANA